MNTFFKKTVLHASLAVSLALAAASGAAHARDFRASDVHPADYPTVVTVKEMGKMLGDRV
jgi:TRAP-type C4-dicarboxylate transport system substrate-binding protein